MYFSKLSCLRGFALFIFLFPLISYAEKIDFTRYLLNYQIADREKGQKAFFGSKGPARLIISRSNLMMNLEINLNNNKIIVDDSFNGKKDIEIPIDLIKENTLYLNVEEINKGDFTLRIKQTAEVNLNVISRIHFNTNVTDFSRAKNFYNSLGFEKLSGAPETNTQAMARAMGIKTPTSYDGSQGGEAGGYVLHAELLGINNYNGGVIDVIEFTIPRNEEKPYSAMNNIGMVSASMYSSNINSDYEYMKSIGINFISSPIKRSDGKNFAIFQDPDGTFYKLIEGVTQKDQKNITNIYKIGEVTFNISDLERSKAWYKMFGYKISNTLPETESLEVSKAMGFDKAIKTKGNLMKLEGDGSEIELIQWIEPNNNTKPYPIPINHPGIHRIAFATTDIEADVRELELQGVQFISGITPCCTGPDSSSGIIAFYDPDGIIVELAEMPFYARILFPIILWFRGLID